MIIVGIAAMNDLTDNLEIIKGDLTFTDEDQALLTEYSTLAYEGDYIKGLTAETIKGFLDQIPG